MAGLERKIQPNTQASATAMAGYNTQMGKPKQPQVRAKSLWKDPWGKIKEAGRAVDKTVIQPCVICGVAVLA